MAAVILLQNYWLLVGAANNMLFLQIYQKYLIIHTIKIKKFLLLKMLFSHLFTNSENGSGKGGGEGSGIEKAKCIREVI
jgi:hypothetical protein